MSSYPNDENDATHLARRNCLGPVDDFSINNPPPIKSFVGASLFGAALDRPVGSPERMAFAFQPSFDKIDVVKGQANGSDLHRDPTEEARELGLVLVDSQDMKLRPHLQIDLDTPEAVRDFEQKFEKWKANNGSGTCYDAGNGYVTNTPLMTTSKSGVGMHAYIRLSRGIPPHERVAMQAVLGSDLAREMFCLLRLEKGNGLGNIVLFETHEEAERVWAFLAKDPGSLSFMPAS